MSKKLARVHTVNSGAGFGPEALDSKAFMLFHGSKDHSESRSIPGIKKPLKSGLKSWLQNNLCDSGHSLNLPEPNEVPHLKNGVTLKPHSVTVRILERPHEKHLAVPLQALSGTVWLLSRHYLPCLHH